MYQNYTFVLYFWKKSLILFFIFKIFTPDDDNFCFYINPTQPPKPPVLQWWGFIFFDPATGGTYTTELSAPTHNPLWLKNSLLNPI